MRHLRAWYYFGSLAAVYLSSPSLIVNELATLTGVPLGLLNLIIFVNAGFLFVRHAPGVRIGRYGSVFASLLLLTIVYLFFVWIVAYGFNTSGSGPRAVVKTLLMTGFAYAIMNSRGFDLEGFSRSFITIVSIVALLSVVLYAGYQTGYLSVDWADVAGHQRMIKGLGGYLNTVLPYYQSPVGISIRSQSYFTEPANFGQFLAFPLFLSLDIYRRSRQVRWLSAFVIMLVATVLTFSVAALFGLLFAAILLIGVRPWLVGDRHRRRSVGRIALTLVLSVLLVLAVQQGARLVFGTGQATIVSKGGDAALFERRSRADVYLEVLEDHPFGFIEFAESFGGNAGLPMDLLINGGIPLFLLVGVLLAHFYATCLKAVLVGREGLAYAGVLAMMPAFLWEGQISEAYFLFHIAFVYTLVDHHRLTRSNLLLKK
ncbi:hypothetical protein JYT20_00835 [Rhodothermus sp. AH-315-K08]|nr:hypothetical protein [Rhodothermus sp. AH-315-K08]